MIMVHYYALKRDGKLDKVLALSLSDVAQRQSDLEVREYESGVPSPKSEVKMVIALVIPKWIARFIKDRV